MYVRITLDRFCILVCDSDLLHSDDTMPESRMSHISEHEISDHEPVSQLRQRRKRRVKGYCLDTDESAASMTDEEPPIFEEDDSTYCDDRPSEGTWVEEEEDMENSTVITMGSMSWIATQILPRFQGQESTVNVELNAFEDAVNRVSPYAELKSAACDADFQKVLDQVRSEWRWGINIVCSRPPKKFPQISILTVYPRSSWRSAGMIILVLRVAHVH